MKIMYPFVQNERCIEKLTNKTKYFKLSWFNE